MSAEKDAGGAVDGRRRLNFKSPTFGSVAVADNAGADCIDVTITPDGMKAQKAGGTILGGRAKLNFIEGANVTFTVADAPADDRINVTVASDTGTIKSIQRLAIELSPGVTTYDTTITAVDITKTILCYLGQSLAGDAAGLMARAYLLNSTTVRATRISSGVETWIGIDVVEFN